MCGLYTSCATLLASFYSKLTKRKRTLVQCARTYNRILLRTRRFLRHREHLEMSYEALATSPEREVARAVEWLGLDFEPGQMDWAEKEHHHIQGNHLRRNRDGRISLDRRWETGLTTWQKVCIPSSRDSNRAMSCRTPRIEVRITPASAAPTPASATPTVTMAMISEES